MWGAGLSFHRCHAEINVPVDPYLDGVFDGEEGSRGIRFFTHGYDVYSPHRVLVTHDYVSFRLWIVLSRKLFRHLEKISIYSSASIVFSIALVAWPPKQPSSPYLGKKTQEWDCTRVGMEVDGRNHGGSQQLVDFWIKESEHDARFWRTKNGRNPRRD